MDGRGRNILNSMCRRRGGRKFDDIKGSEGKRKTEIKMKHGETTATI